MGCIAMCMKGQSTTSVSKQVCHTYGALGDESDVYYSLTIVNNSYRAWNFFLIQQPPYHAIKSLAWMVSPDRIKTGEKITFSWTVSYEFMCAATSVSLPGEVFHATDTDSADLTTHNCTTLSIENGLPTLSQPIQGQPAGSLLINVKSDVPQNKFSVGVANSKKGVYAVDAMPNMNYVFTMDPSFYFICATDNDVAEGEVINPVIYSIATGVKFPINVYAMTATYQSDNTWVVQPS